MQLSGQPTNQWIDDIWCAIDAALADAKAPEAERLTKTIEIFPDIARKALARVLNQIELTEIDGEATKEVAATA